MERPRAPSPSKPIPAPTLAPSSSAHCANVGTNADDAAFNLESTGTWIVKGFTINSDGSIQKAGIRIANSNNSEIVDNTVNHAFIGIFVSNANNSLVQNNLCENSTDQHGIYISDNTDDTSVLGNTLTGNNWDGLHMNAAVGEPNQNAIIEDNVIFGNNLAGMDIEGIDNAYFANNLIYNNTKEGITLHSQDQTAAGNPTPDTMNNTFVNNTIVGNGMSGIQMLAPDTQETIFNNIFMNSNAEYGAIAVTGTPSGLVSDYNIVCNDFSTDLGTSTLTLSQWQSSTGQDKHDIISAATSLFTNTNNNVFTLLSSSPAIDSGIATLNGSSAPTIDFAGNSRPQGNGYDIGAYESAGTKDTTPPTLSAISSSNITSSSETITWTTNEASSSQIEYGTTTSYGSSTTLNSNMVTSHSVTISGLAGSTTYHFEVVSTDASGNQAVSSDFTFTTPVPDLTPPVLSAITSTSITATSATITWTTNEASDSQANYGGSSSYGSSTTLNTALVTTHSVTITGLLPSTTYHYDVLSHDASGNLATSSDFTFSTTALGNGPFSILTNSGTPVTVDDTDTTATMLGIKFQSALNGFITGVKFYKGPTNTGTHIGYLWSNTGTLLATGTFTNESATGWQTVTFSTPVAITANTTYVAGYYAPNGGYCDDENTFNTTGISNYPLTALSASAAGGANGVYSYGGQGTFPTSSWNDSNYWVDAVFSQTSNDTTPPVLSSISSGGLTSTGATVSWTTNEASTTQIKYGTSSSYGTTTTLNSSLVTSHSVALSGLAASTTYHFEVISTDAAGNQAVSSDFTFTTSAAGDITAPTAAINSSGPIIPGSEDYDFTVAYSDNTALNASSINNATVQVTGPNSFSETATLISLSSTSNGTPIIATYQITEPSGIWSVADNGTYTVSVAGNGVEDTAGNFMSAGTIGTFAFDITDTTPITASNITSSVQTTSATIIWTTNKAGTSELNYGTSSSYGQSSPFVSTLVTSHTVTLTGLTPGTTYHYDVKSWDASDNHVVSTDLTFTTANTADTTNPTASLTAGNVTTGGGNTYTFTVTYSDNVAVNVSTLNSNDIVVTGPNGFSQAATFVSVNTNTNGTPRTATYSVSTPGGSWDVTDNGTYTVTLQANQVADSSGQFAAAGSLGTFAVNVPDTTAPTASLTASNLTSGGGNTYTFTVTYSDNVAVNVSTLNTGDVLVTGPGGFSQTATFVSVNTNTNGTPRTATYRITAPGGTWDLGDNGTYTVSLQANQVADTSGNFAAAGSLGTFAVNVPDTTDPTAAISLSNINASGSSTYTFTVAYSDNVGVNVSSLGSGNVQGHRPQRLQPARHIRLRQQQHQRRQLAPPPTSSTSATRPGSVGHRRQRHLHRRRPRRPGHRHLRQSRLWHQQHLRRQHLQHQPAPRRIYFLQRFDRV